MAEQQQELEKLVKNKVVLVIVALILAWIIVAVFEPIVKAAAIVGGGFVIYEYVLKPAAGVE